MTISSFIAMVEVSATVVEDVSAMLKEVTISVVEAFSAVPNMMVSVLEAPTVEEVAVRLISVPSLVTISVVQMLTGCMDSHTSL